MSMTSSNNPSLPAVEMNNWAKSSSWLAICSLLPYLIFGMVFYIEKRLGEHFFQVDFVLALFCLFWGILLGSATLITGVVAIREIKNSQNTEKGIGLAAFSMVLGAAAIIINILFLLVPFAMFMFKD